MSEIRTVLVTGIAGGVGSTVAQALTRHGYKVRGLARPEDCFATIDLGDAEIVRGYVEDNAIIGRIIHGCDAVVNCAALLPNALSTVEDDAFHRVNVQGAVNVLERAIEHRLMKALFFSTISVVDHVQRHITEESLEEYIEGSRDPYLNSKIEAERRLKGLSRSFSGQLHIIRPAFIYGPRNFATWRDGLQLVKDGKMSLIGDGNAALPLIYADDIAEFVVRALQFREVGPAFNVHILSNPEATTLSSVFNFIADELRVPRPKRVPYFIVRIAAELATFIPKRLLIGRLKLLTKARVMQYSRGYDMTGVNREPLGYIPAIGYKVGLPRMLDDYFDKSVQPKTVVKQN